MSEQNHRLAVTVWENKVKNPIIPLWNKVQWGFKGSRVNLSNLMSELKTLKDFINKDMNQKSLALRDVDVIVEFYPDFIKQSFALSRFIKENLEKDDIDDRTFLLGIKEITDTLVSNENIVISTVDATFLFGIKALVNNENISPASIKTMTEQIWDAYNKDKK